MTVRQGVSKALGLLSTRDRRLLWLAMGIQMATSLLDVAGVFLLGLVGALAVTTVQSQPPPQVVLDIADRVGLGGLTSQELVVAFASAAAALLLFKSVFSSLLTRRVFIFLANRQALVSARLAKALLSQPLVKVQSRSSQETSFALIQGAGAATITILGQFTILVTEAAMLLALAIGLVLVSPIVAVASIAFFAGVAFVLQKAMGGWATRAGTISARADIASLNTVQEAIAAYREITVLDRRELYTERVQASRWEAAKSSADRTFIAMFPKYMFEAALVVGGFLLALVLFAMTDAVQAVGTLALFLAAGTRVMPSILRLQSASLGLRSGSATAAPTFALAEDLGHPVAIPEPAPAATLIRERLLAGHADFEPAVSVLGVTVTYPGATAPALSNAALSLSAGESAALVGPTGAGKSTLADVILGVAIADTGRVVVGGVSPSEASLRWPGAISYVPQDVALADGTIRDNVALGLPRDAVDDEMVWEALMRAHLAEHLRSERNGLDTIVGEAGVRLSGGQRQRLGIARALYSRPRLIVLDEATSALDAETEAAITATLRELEGTVTTVVIAHRLSTVQHVDTVTYLDRGEILAQGTFSEVRAAVPALDRQANLMGL